MNKMDQLFAEGPCKDLQIPPSSEAIYDRPLHGPPLPLELAFFLPLTMPMGGSVLPSGGNQLPAGPCK